MINVLGDWQGDISFGQPDLWVGSRIETPRNPAVPGTDISYHFTIFNNGDSDATGVQLTDLFDDNFLSFLDFSGNASVNGNKVLWDLGIIPAGGSTEVDFNARVNDSIPIGQTSINNTVSVSSAETDEDTSNNTDMVTLLAYKENPAPLGIQIPYTPTPLFKITKTSSAQGPLHAGNTVDYKIVIVNEGGSAYHSVVSDVIKSEDDEIIHEESWDLGEIFPQEEIIVNYTALFNASTTSGIYTNYAQVKAIGRYPSLDYGWFADSPVVSTSVEIIGLEEAQENEVSDEETGGTETASEPEPEEKPEEIKDIVLKIKEPFAGLLPHALASSNEKLFESSILDRSDHNKNSSTPFLYPGLAAAVSLSLDDFNLSTSLILGLLLFISLCLIILKSLYY